MGREKILDALAQYVDALSASARNTHHAEDRSMYTSHLAAAARIFSCLHSGRLDSAWEIASEQDRHYGVNFLSGDEGAAATTAFSRFASTFSDLRAR